MKLVVYDLEGVLVDHRSIWIDISEITGTSETNMIHRERYIYGEITYKEWSDIVVGSWDGFAVEKIDDLVKSTPIMKGARETIERFRDCDFKQGIISNSISLLTDSVGELLGIDSDYITANELLVECGVLTGSISSYHGWGDKVKTLRRYAKSLEIPMKDTIAVGDDINDIEMIEESGLGIAFNPKSTLLEEAADVVIREKDLRGILPYVLD
ncbi:MAG: HAD family phosphatase [Halobacteriota archaeon]|nr:HAD family phosphatase [Halobacteriota archaeon]